MKFQFHFTQSFSNHGFRSRDMCHLSRSDSDLGTQNSLAASRFGEQFEACKYLHWFILISCSKCLERTETCRNHLPQSISFRVPCCKQLQHLHENEDMKPHDRSQPTYLYIMKGSPWREHPRFQEAASSAPTSTPLAKHIVANCNNRKNLAGWTWDSRVFVICQDA